MRCTALSMLLVWVMFTGVLSNVIGQQHPGSRPSAVRNSRSGTTCQSDREVIRAVLTLSSGRYADQQDAVNLLKVKARQSSSCRTQVITSLLSEMDQLRLELTGGTPQFYLWHYGTRLLGELKAVEALDLLIANFDRHDGTPFPFNHHPAIGAVIGIGEIALPKLQSALKEKRDPDVRRYAVFCIALIGGQHSKRILRQALRDEADPCVASCIKASLTAYKNRRRPSYISDEARTKWYTTFLCT